MVSPDLDDVKVSDPSVPTPEATEPASRLNSLRILRRWAYAGARSTRAPRGRLVPAAPGCRQLTAVERAARLLEVQPTVRRPVVEVQQPHARRPHRSLEVVTAGFIRATILREIGTGSGGRASAGPESENCP
jgi:hypothetical protein